MKVALVNATSILSSYKHKNEKVNQENKRKQKRETKLNLTT
jgi:hypothetical protein